MKIFYISYAALPSRTANSIQVVKMCHAFSENSHCTFLAAPDKKKEYEKSSKEIFSFYGIDENFVIKKIFYPNLPGRGIFYAICCLWHAIKFKPDIVYSREITGALFTAFFGFETIYESHTPIWYEAFSKRLSFRLLKNLKKFKKLVVISDSLKNAYSKNFRFSYRQIQVAHDGAKIIKNFDKNFDKWIGRNNALQIGYLGHLYKGKGMEIISKIASRLPDVDFHVIGGLEKDIFAWKSKARHKNLMFHGFVPHKDVSKYLRMLDVCLLPNQKTIHGYTSKKINKEVNISVYTSPLKLFEYMAHKKAIIASDLPVLREILNFHNSILVDSENTTEWVAAIVKLKNSKLRNRIANNAYNDFMDKYTWTKRAELVISGGGEFLKKSHKNCTRHK